MSRLGKKPRVLENANSSPRLLAVPEITIVTHSDWKGTKGRGGTEEISSKVGRADSVREEPGT